jgi:thioesterase domain-containing protein
MNNVELLNLLHEEIPLSKAMGVVISDKDKDALVAPLLLNRNHLDTAFGGSLASLLILSCYAWLFQKMSEKGFPCHVLIQEGHTDFLLPVKEDLRAFCVPPDLEKYNKFLETFRRKGVARIKLEAEIRTNEGKGCYFRGLFVAQRAK